MDFCVVCGGFVCVVSSSPSLSIRRGLISGISFSCCSAAYLPATPAENVKSESVLTASGPMESRRPQIARVQDISGVVSSREWFCARCLLGLKTRLKRFWKENCKLSR